MSYIQNKLDEFRNIKLIDGQEADGIMENSKMLSEWIEQALTDYHNHIVEKLKCGECNGSGAYSSPYDYSPCRHCDGTGFNIINGCFNDILQDTNPKEL